MIARADICSGTSAGTNYVFGVDGLRAIAVISIIIFHLCAAWLPGGFVGVDIFYVISGFVVARSVKTLPAGTLKEYFVAFYRRRVLRIYPAISLFVLVAVAFCVLFVPLAISTRTFEWTGLSSLFAVSNLVIWGFSDSYFDSASSFQPFLHTWSLGVEEQYYILFPFLSFFMLTGARRDRVSGKWVTRLVAAMSVASLILCAYLSIKKPSFAFYMMPTRFWELGLGLFLQVWVDRVENGRRIFVADWVARYPGVTGTLSCLGLLASFVWATETAFPFPWALLPCISTAGLIATVTLDGTSTLSKVLSWTPVAWFGKLSYSLYLWHWGVIVAMRWTVGMDSPAQQLTAVIIMVGLSALSYYFVERPLRFSPVLKRLSNLRFGASFGAATFVILVLGAGLTLAKPILSLSVTKQQSVWASNYYADIHGSCRIEIAKQSLAGGKVFNFVPHSCQTQRSVLFAGGDSHSLTYNRMYYRLAAQDGLEVHNYGMGGCAFLPGKVVEAPSCTKFRHAAKRAILAAAKPGDILFLSALWTDPYRDNWNLPLKSTPDTDYVVAPTAENIARARAFVEPFLAKGMHVIVEGVKPSVTTAGFRCSDWFNRWNRYCTSGYVVSRREILWKSNPAMQYLAAATLDMPGVSLWKPFDVLCPGSQCSYSHDGMPLYADTNHLTAYGVDLLYPGFKVLIFSATNKQGS